MLCYIYIYNSDIVCYITLVIHVIKVMLYVVIIKCNIVLIGSKTENTIFETVSVGYDGETESGRPN